jgi:hypothetical protein
MDRGSYEIKQKTDLFLITELTLARVPYRVGISQSKH